MALSAHFHRPKPIPFIMTLLAVLTLFGLGTWQVQRLLWKEQLLAQIEQAAETAPLQSLPEDIASHRFYRVQLRGEYLQSPQFHLAARYFKSQLGYSVLTPFRLSGSGDLVLVSRGWVPAAIKTQGKIPNPPEGELVILAQIRTSDERNPFTPINQPEQNIWFGRDASEMGASASLNFLPFTLDLIGDQNPDLLPVPSDGKLRPRNDHLHYAITWYAIGLAALIISLLYHRKKTPQS